LFGDLDGSCDAASKPLQLRGNLSFVGRISQSAKIRSHIESSAPAPSSEQCNRDPYIAGRRALAVGGDWFGVRERVG